MKQTAVEWLVEHLNLDETSPNYNKLTIEKAEKMEKEQIKDSFVECWKSNVPDGIECKLDAEQYYKENYEQ